MKTIIFLCFSLFFLNYTLLYSQSKMEKSKDIVLLFDYKSKQWSYPENDTTKKGKPYFAVKYKSQPVIKVTSLPDTTTRVVINDQYFDVIPKLDTVDKKNKMGIVFTSKSYSFTQTMPMVDSDEIIYSVTINDSTGTPLHTTEAFAKVYGKVKIDLSTGVLFHSLQDESYFFSDAGNNQSSISKDRSKGKIKPLFPVIMTNIYYQTKGLINPGVSLGLGLDDSGKAGYYVGGTLIFGDRQRAILSVGWALRPTDVLKGKYEEGQIISTANLPESADLVESTYKSGWFLSITYNLTSNVSKR